MNYLIKLNYFQRKILCKWRCRSNELPIASSRFILTDEILCPLCHNESLGDELHYLFKCSFFDDDRTKYIGDILQNYNYEYVLDILKDQNANLLPLLIDFINLIMSIFQYRNKWDHDISHNSSLFEDEDLEVPN